MATRLLRGFGNLDNASELIEIASKLVNIAKKAQVDFLEVLSDPLWTGDGLLLRRAHNTCETVSALMAVPMDTFRTVIEDALKWGQHNNTQTRDHIDVVFDDFIGQFQAQIEKEDLDRDPICLTMMWAFMTWLSSGVQIDNEAKKTLGSILSESARVMFAYQTEDSPNEQGPLWRRFADAVRIYNGRGILPPSRGFAYEDISFNGRLDDQALLHAFLEALDAARPPTEASLRAPPNSADTLADVEQSEQRSALIARIKSVMKYGCAIDYQGIAKTLTSQIARGVADGAPNEKQLIQHVSTFLSKINATLEEAENPSSVIAQASTLVTTLNDITKSIQSNNFHSVTPILEKLDQTLDKMQNLDTNQANTLVYHLSRIVQHIQGEDFHSIAPIIKKLDHVLQKVQDLDTTQASARVADLSSIVQRLSEGGIPRIERTLDKVDQVLDRVATLDTTHAGQLVASLNKIVSAATEHSQRMLQHPVSAILKIVVAYIVAVFGIGGNRLFVEYAMDVIASHRGVRNTATLKWVLESLSPITALAAEVAAFTGLYAAGVWAQDTSTKTR